MPEDLDAIKRKAAKLAEDLAELRDEIPGDFISTTEINEFNGMISLLESYATLEPDDA